LLALQWVLLALLSPFALQIEEIVISCKLLLQVSKYTILDSFFRTCVLLVFFCLLIVPFHVMLPAPTSYIISAI